MLSMFNLDVSITHFIFCRIKSSSSNYKNYDPSEASFLLQISIQDGWDLYGPYEGNDGIPISVTYSDSHNVKT